MCYWEEKISEQIETLLLVFLSIPFNKLLWVSPWTISMGHFRIVFMEAHQHQQQSFIDKEGVVFALPVLLCTALKKTSTPPRSQGRQPSLQPAARTHPQFVEQLRKHGFFWVNINRHAQWGLFWTFLVRRGYYYIAIRTSGSATDQTDRLLYN